MTKAHDDASILIESRNIVVKRVNRLLDARLGRAAAPP